MHIRFDYVKKYIVPYLLIQNNKYSFILFAMSIIYYRSIKKQNPNIVYFIIYPFSAHEYLLSKAHSFWNPFLIILKLNNKELKWKKKIFHIVFVCATVTE